MRRYIQLHAHAQSPYIGERERETLGVYSAAFPLLLARLLNTYFKPTMARRAPPLLANMLCSFLPRDYDDSRETSV